MIMRWSKPEDPSEWPGDLAVARWARLHFGGIFKRWHIVYGIHSICGTQSFDYKRVEWSETKPETGKLCKHCIARMARHGITS